MKFGSKPIVKIDGTELAAAQDHLLAEVIVHDHRHLPDMCELRLRDEAHDVLGTISASVGKRLEISATAVGDENSDEPLFVGEITALETEYDAAIGSHAIVRAYDHSHRLMKHRMVRAFQGRSIADIVREVADEAEVPLGKLEGPTATIPYVSQANQTDWDFLQRLASEAGCVLSVVLGELTLTEPTAASDAPASGELRRDTDPLQLTLGQNLRNMRARVTSAGQAAEVTVRSWDASRKEAITATSSAETSSVEIGTGPADLAGAFSVGTELSCHRPFDQQDKVDNAASALAELLAASHAEAYASADGHPKLRAGSAVSAALLGEPFDGKYTLTSTKHIFDEDGYRTDLEISGSQERSVLSLTSPQQAAPVFHGVVTALVADVDDPEDRGRVRLAFPWMSADFESYWARIAVPDAGPEGRGIFFLPEVGDEVLVAFIHGDFESPVVVGSMWNGVDLPPVDDELLDGTSKEVMRREIISRNGHRLTFSDDASHGGFTLQTSDGENTILVDETGEISVSVGDNKLTIKKNGDVTLDCDGDFEVKAAGKVKIQAAQDLELSGNNVKIDGSAQTAITGQPIKLN